MKKHLSPGILWLAFFIISLTLILSKFDIKNLFITRLQLEFFVILVGFIVVCWYTYHVDIGKSQTLSIFSFIFGLIFLIPLLNLIFGIFSIYLGVKALIKIKHQPKEFGGKWFAIIGIALGAIVYLTYIIGTMMCLSGYKTICKNIGLDFLS